VDRPWVREQRNQRMAVIAAALVPGLILLILLLSYL
jgi:hypothetical protein